MSHERVRSIGKIKQNAEGKWSCDITSASSNCFLVNPRTGKECYDFQKWTSKPMDSEEDVNTMIIHDFISGNFVAVGKVRQNDFLQECEYGVIHNLAYKRARLMWTHIFRWYDVERNLCEKMGCKHRQDLPADMLDRIRKAQVMCHKKKDAYERTLARDYAKWTPCKDRFTVRIDGARIVSWRESSRNGSAHWKYCQPWDTTTKSKEFSAVEKAKIERRLAGKREVTSEKITGNAEKAKAA